MKFEISVLRGDKYQNFYFEGTGEETVATVLDTLNYRDDLFDTAGNPAPRIAWDCSCGQGICGACAMVINGTPALACKYPLKNCRGKVVTLEPLSKFPRVGDLRVDRSALYEIPIATGLWSESKGTAAEDYDLQYAATKCLKCGLCVEVCPNAGIRGKLYGAVYAADCFLVKKQGSPQEQARAKQAYRAHFSDHCSKSLSCAAVCPAGIDFKKLIAKMNRR